MILVLSQPKLLVNGFDSHLISRDYELINLFHHLEADEDPNGGQDQDHGQQQQRGHQAVQMRCNSLGDGLELDKTLMKI